MEIAIGIIITLLVALLGLLLNHISQCSRFHERLAKMEAEMLTVKHEIGDHGSGLRGSMHDLRDRMTPLAVWAEREMERRT
jgi:hypothetical protein